MTDEERRSLILDHCTQATPRSPGGVYLDIRISLYNNKDSHSAIGPLPTPHPKHAVVNQPNDDMALEQIKLLIKEARARQDTRRRAR